MYRYLNMWDFGLPVGRQLEYTLWVVMFKSSVLLDCYAGIKQDLTGFIILLSNQSAD